MSVTKVDHVGYIRYDGTSVTKVEFTGHTHRPEFRLLKLTTSVTSVTQVDRPGQTHARTHIHGTEGDPLRPVYFRYIRYTS